MESSAISNTVKRDMDVLSNMTQHSPSNNTIQFVKTKTKSFNKSRIGIWTHDHMFFPLRIIYYQVKGESLIIQLWIFFTVHWSQMFIKVKCHAALLQWHSLLGLLSWALSLYIWTCGSCRFQPHVPNLQMGYNNFTMMRGYQNVITTSQHYFR